MSFSCNFTNSIDNINKRNMHPCWRDIMHYLNKNKNNYIYITKFNKNKKIYSEERLNVLIRLINKITPCSVKTKGKTNYIKFKLLTRYDNNLFLLNFIRNLWYCPVGYNIDLFFNELLNNKKRICSLRKLMDANIKACKNVIQYRHHSNALNNLYHAKMVTRTKKELLSWKGTNLDNFMTNK